MGPSSSWVPQDIGISNLQNKQAAKHINKSPQLKDSIIQEKRKDIWKDISRPYENKETNLMKH